MWNKWFASAAAFRPTPSHPKNKIGRSLWERWNAFSGGPFSEAESPWLFLLIFNHVFLWPRLFSAGGLRSPHSAVYEEKWDCSNTAEDWLHSLSLLGVCVCVCAYVCVCVCAAYRWLIALQMTTVFFCCLSLHVSLSSFPSDVTLIVGHLSPPALCFRQNFPGWCH